MDSAKFSPGDVLDSRYRIDSLIAVGGMGAVYAGTHLLLHKRIAVKVLRSDLQSRQAMVERFQREAIAASAIGHENIVSVTDMGTTPDGIAYLVMELLTGQNLADLIEADAPLNAQLACDISLEILSGIAASPGRRTRTSKVLAVPPMRIIGDWSYSLYLWHWPGRAPAPGAGPACVRAGRHGTASRRSDRCTPRA